MAEYIGHQHSETNLTASGQSATLDIKGVARMSEIIAHLSVSSLTGTAPTMDIDIEDSFDQTNWGVLISFAQASGATNEFLPAAGSPTRPFAPYLRIAWTAGGTVTDCDFVVNIGLKG